jgi:DnaJ-class molecular chaperone
MKIHPDQNGDQLAFQTLAEAYEVLKDEKSKKMYDITGTHFKKNKIKKEQKPEH